MIIFPGVKDLLEDLNPQLLNTIISEFDKVEGESAPEPTRTSTDVASVASAPSGRGKAGAAAPDALDDLFPRVEIDGLLKGTTILSDAKSDAWKTKKEALEALQAILDQGSNKRLKPTMGRSSSLIIGISTHLAASGEIGQVLKARVTDTNKAVQSLALDIVARIATGMGKPFEKQTRFFVIPVATVLSDQKAPIRAAALQTLTSIATACEGLESMSGNLGTALETSNPLQKATLLNWLVDWFKVHDSQSSLDLNNWVGPVLSSLDDRNGDIRKGAQALLPTLVVVVGYEHVLQQTSSLKPASRSTAAPLIQAARGSMLAPTPAAPKVASAKPSAHKATPTQKVESPPPQCESPPPARGVPASKLMGVRRKLPQGSTPHPDSRAETPTEAPASRLPGKPGIGLKRPGGAIPAHATPTPSPSTGLAPTPFTGPSLDAKKGRLVKDAQKWINEAGPTRKDLAELLQHQMEPQATRELVSLLFSHDHNAVNDHIAGLSVMYEFYSSVQSGDDKFQLPLEDVRTICIANSDLALKYVSMKAHEPQSNLVQKCLDVVEAVIAFFQSVDYQLSDPEALCFVPTIIYKVWIPLEIIRVYNDHLSAG